MLTSSGARIAACADVLLPSHSLGCFMMSSLIGSCNVTKYLIGTIIKISRSEEFHFGDSDQSHLA